MKRLRNVLGLWLLTAMTAFASADAKILRVAIASDNAPLAYAVNGEAVGMEADLARLLQTQLGAQLQLKLMPVAEVVPALERGEVDIAMAGLVVGAALEKRVDFAQPYLRTGQMAIIRTDDVMRFRAPATLLQEGVKVGVVGGSAGADYVGTAMNKPVVTQCPNVDECLQALLGRRIDVFVGSAAVSWGLATDKRYAALMSLYRPLTEEYLAWAVPKNNAALRERLSVALQNMRRTQMFEHILNRWIPVRIDSE